MNSIPKYISPEAKATLIKRLKVASAGYWVLLLVMIVGTNAGGDLVGVVAFLLWFAGAVWLAVTVADAASLSGGSGFIWGCGTLFLGPLGALLFPFAQLARLRQ